MPRSSLVSDVAVYSKDGRDTSLMDRSEFAYSVRRTSAVSRLSESMLRSTADLGLYYAVPLRHRYTRDGWLISWAHAGIHFAFLVPSHMTRGLYSIRMTVVFNPLRMLRARLSRSERMLDRVPPDAKTNVLDPRAVPPEVAHQRVVKLVPRVARRLRNHFVAIMDRLFNAKLAAPDVWVTASQVEFAWDRACDCSNTAIHVFTPAFLATIPNALKRFRFGREDADPHIELSGDGVLKASFRKGWTLKIYAIPGGILRYECQLTAEALRAILGHRMRLTSRSGLEEDLARIAERVYSPIFEVQQSLATSKVPRVEHMFTALVPNASEDLALHIGGQLVSFGQVRCNRHTPSVYKVMRRMHGRGLMEKSKAPGFWVPTPSYAVFVQAVVRQCLVLSGAADAR